MIGLVEEPDGKPLHGTLTLNGAGTAATVTYAPPAGFEGWDYFKFSAVGPPAPPRRWRSGDENERPAPRTGYCARSVPFPPPTRSE